MSEIHGKEHSITSLDELIVLTCRQSAWITYESTTQYVGVSDYR